MESYGSLLVKFSLVTFDGLTLTPSLGVKTVSRLQHNTQQVPANFPTIFSSSETRMILLPESDGRVGEQTDIIIAYGALHYIARL